MSTISEQIEAIQKEIRETPYHKATEHHIGKLRAKLSHLREKEIESATKKGGGSGGYAVKKQGDATIVLVGPPSAGKSTLLNKLTNAQSKVAPYAFTTVTVIPGMMEHKSARIQILDVPGLIEGAEEGKGRGREVLSVVRGTDLLIIMSDVSRLAAVGRIKNALYRNGIRMNQVPPEVAIGKKLKGGLIIHSNIKQNITKETIKGVADEFGYKNAEITIKQKLTMETLVDAFARNRVYIPTLVVINKIDTKESENGLAETIEISAEKDINLNVLKSIIWERLEFVRMYLVRLDEVPSFDNPIIMKIGETLKDVKEKLGTDFAEGKSKARIWGTGAKFEGQQVSLSTKVAERMQVRFV